MSTILRFLDTDETTVLLDLNSPTGFRLGRGFSLGTADEDQEWLEQAPYDGATLTSSHSGITTMAVPLGIHKQVGFAAMETLIASLSTQLRRMTSVLEFRPHGAAASYLIDAYRAPVPSLFRGVDLESVAHRLWDDSIPVYIPRHPKLRGAGEFI